MGESTLKKDEMETFAWSLWESPSSVFLLDVPFCMWH